MDSVSFAMRTSPPNAEEARSTRDAARWAFARRAASRFSDRKGWSLFHFEGDVHADHVVTRLVAHEHVLPRSQVEREVLGLADGQVSALTERALLGHLAWFVNIGLD